MRVPGSDGNIVHEARYSDELEEGVERAARVLAFLERRPERGELRRGTPGQPSQGACGGRGSVDSQCCAGSVKPS